MISDDEYLERIVAGIHAVTSSEADVKWNDTINGRQFDVSIRFSIGPLNCLAVIEVKNRTRRASASDVEAFVTKARDQGANKLVFVTVAGYQDGAKNVALRHGVDLFKVSFDDRVPTLPLDMTVTLLKKKGAPDTPISLSVGQPRLVSCIEDIWLVYRDESRAAVPNDPSQMTYYCRKTKLSDGRSLDKLIDAARFSPVELNRRRIEEIQIFPPQNIRPPDEYFFPSGVITSIECAVAGRLATPIQGNAAIDVGVFALPVIYENVVTGSKSKFSIHELPLGEPSFVVSEWYFTQSPLAYFYCEEVRGDICTLHNVESFQLGHLLTGTLKVPVKASGSYIRVRDKEIIERLRKRWADFQRIRS